MSEALEAEELGFECVVDATGWRRSSRTASAPRAAATGYIVFGVAPEEVRVSLSSFRIYNDEVTVVGSMAVVSAAHAEVFATALEVVWASTRERGAQPGNAGLIHGDLHKENYLFRGSDAQAIDFDGCGWGFFLHDLAVTLSELLRPLPERAETHLEAFGILRRTNLLMWVIESREHTTFRDDWQAWTRDQLRELAAAVDPAR